MKERNSTIKMESNETTKQFFILSTVAGGFVDDSQFYPHLLLSHDSLIKNILYNSKFRKRK